MNLRNLLVICRKELLEALRDRRTLLMNIGLPLVLYPVLMIAAGKIVDVQKAAAEARASIIAVWGQAPSGIEAHLAPKEATLMAWAEMPGALRVALETRALPPPPPEKADDTPETAASTPAGDGAGDADGAKKNATTEAGSDTAAGEDKAASAGGTQEAAREKEERPDPLRDAARDVLRARKVDAVLVFWPEGIVSPGQQPVALYFDSVRDDSRKAAERIRRGLEKLGDSLVARRLSEHGLPSSVARPVALTEQNVAQVDRRLGHALGSILPLMLILLSTMGGLYPAIDMTAGEKERGTMQTLLCAPVRPIEILSGKLLAIGVISLITALINIVSLSASVARMIPKQIGGELSILNLLPILPMLLPIIVVVAAISLTVCIFARDFKDAMNMITPFFLVLMLAPGIAALPRSELNAWTAFIPMVNISLLIKAMLIGEAKPELIFLTMASSLAFAVAAVVVAARVFAREQIVLGGREPLRVVLGLERKRGGAPSPTLAFLFFMVVLMIMFYATLLIEKAGIVTMVLVTQYGLMLAPVLLMIAAFGLTPRETLGLRPPSLRAVVGAVVVGLSGWTVAAGVVLRLLPPPGDLQEAMKKLLQLGDTPSSLGLSLVLLALTPALCEELLFRGFLMNGLRPLGRWPAIITTALMFGLLHGSIYRMAPTAFLGILMGWVAWRTGSTFASMIVHALNNGLVIVAMHYMPDVAETTDVLPWSIVAVGSVVLALGLWLVGGASPSDGEAMAGSG